MAAEKKVSLKDLDLDLKKNEQDAEEGMQSDAEDSGDDSDGSLNMDMLNRRDEDFQKIIENENNAIDELHSLLSKTRQKIINSKLNEDNVVNSIKTEEVEVVSDAAATGVSLDNLNTDVELDEEAAANGVCLDSLSEFCKNIGNKSNDVKKNGMYDDSDDEDEGEDNAKTEQASKS
jgi:hypothetical protein